MQSGATQHGHEHTKFLGQTPAILVTGGSGFVGRKLVKKLSDRGDPVVSMYHHRLSEPFPNVFPFSSDMSSADLLASPLRNVKTVIHLAWEGGVVGPPTDPTEPNSVRGSSLPRNVQMVCNLISAMERVGTKRIVFVSALGSSRHADVGFLAEKYMAEFFVLNSKIPERIVIRSSLITGGGTANDKFLRSILRVMKYPAIYPIPDAEGEFSPVHVDDLVGVLSELASCTLKDPCAMIDVRGEESYKIADMFKLISDRYATGKRLPISGVIGRTILPLFERDAKKDLSTPRLKHYMALANQPADKVAGKVAANSDESPLAGALHQRFTSFRESMIRTSDN